jgi:hypothetical protein
VLGLGSGVTFPAITNASLHGVTGEDSSLASGIQSAMQQVGGALGLSCLVTLGLRHAAGQVRHGADVPAAATHGYVLAFHVGSVLLLVGGVLVFLLLERVTAVPHTALVAAEPEPASGPLHTPA